MALTLQGRELTQAHKLAQIELAARAVRESRDILDLLDPARLDDTRLEWLGYQIGSLERFHGASAKLAGAYLDAYRAVEGELAELVWPTFDAVAATISAETMVVGRAKQLIGREPPRTAVGRAWGWYGGAVMRQTLAGGRHLLIDSIEQSRVSLGWRRVTDANPCAFCAMLASRGPAYKSRESASLTGTTRGRRGKRPLGSKFHDRCGCSVEEVFNRWEPTKREQQFIDLYEAAAGGSAKHVLARMRKIDDGSILNDATQPGEVAG